MEENKTNENTIYQDLVKLQGSIKTIKHDKFVDFPRKSGGRIKFSYTTLQKIFEAIKEPMIQSNFAIVQIINTNEDGLFTLKTRLIHSSGEEINSDIVLYNKNLNPQEDGKLFTYYKRYAISAILGIATDDDVDDDNPEDNDVKHEKAKKQKKAPVKKEVFKQDPNIITIDEAEEACLQNLFKELNVAGTFKEILNNFKIEELGQLPEESFDELCDILGNRIKRKNK